MTPIYITLPTNSPLLFGNSSEASIGTPVYAYNFSTSKNFLNQVNSLGILEYKNFDLVNFGRKLTYSFEQYLEVISGQGLVYQGPGGAGAVSRSNLILKVSYAKFTTNGSNDLNPAFQPEVDTTKVWYNTPATNLQIIAWQMPGASGVGSGSYSECLAIINLARQKYRDKIGTSVTYKQNIDVADMMVLSEDQTFYLAQENNFILEIGGFDNATSLRDFRYLKQLKKLPTKITHYLTSNIYQRQQVWQWYDNIWETPPLWTFEYKYNIISDTGAILIPKNTSYVKNSDSSPKYINSKNIINLKSFSLSKQRQEYKK